MDTIDDPDVAAWYEPGYAPGELGNALINGHKSWKRQNRQVLRALGYEGGSKGSC